ncbi:MAG: DUF1214 domain-containing protein [Lachnospiraceae bacterium]|nr:DUF1214 domain-containing protein [Lachnospiraceae bacterium]
MSKDITNYETSLENAKKLFIYSYAIVTSGVLSRGKASQKYTLYHGRKFVKASDKDTSSVVRPNNDNLYSAAWTQLINSPYILEIPDITDRYILANILNTKTDVPFAVGSKNPDTTEKKYIFIYRDNEVPTGYEDYQIVRCEDSRNFFLIRLEAFNEADFKTANAIQDKIIFKAIYPEKLQDRGEAIVGLTTDFIESLTTKEFYQEFASAFIDTVIDEDYIKLAKAFGIEGENGSYDDAYDDILNAGREAAYKEITTYSSNIVASSNGWTYNVDNGNYGENYLYRARVAYFGYGANLAEDSIYPSYGGQILYSDKNYKIHFNKGTLPYAEFFWSITLYGEPSQYLTDNELDRYVINSHMLDDLYYNEDGSLDIYLMNTKPTDDTLIPNWLPSPLDEKTFSLTMRIYGPSKEQLNGEFEGPQVSEI